MNPEFIISIIVRARNEIAGVLERAAGDFDKLTKAEDRSTAAADRNKKATADMAAETEKLHKTHSEFVKSVERGEKSYDDAAFGLKRLASEMDKLARRAPIGSKMADDLNRASVASKELLRQLQTAHDAEAKLAQAEERDRIRREDDRQKMIADRLAAERRAASETVKAEERASVQRRSFVLELIDSVHQADRQREKSAQSLADFEIKEAARVEAARADFAANQAREIRKMVDQADRHQGFLERLFRVDPSKVEQLDNMLEGFEKTLNRNRFSVAALDNRLRGLLVLGVIAFFQQLVSVTTALAATLVSVASTAVQAGAALGGALTAGAAQSIPMIGLLVAAWGRVGAVFKAVEQNQKAAQQAGYDHTQSMESQRAAAKRVEDAEQAVADAQRRVAEATDSLSEARRNGVRELEDLIAAELKARLASESATLAHEQSRAALERITASGDVDELFGAEIDVVERAQAETEAQRRARRLREDLGRTRRRGGVEGLDSVESARRQVREAERARDRARDALSEARRAGGEAAQEVSASQRNLDQLLAQLSPAERRLYRATLRIRENYERLFRPITDIIVDAHTRAFDRVNQIMDDPRIIRPLTRLAETIGTQMDRVVGEATSDRSLDFFERMVTEARTNLEPLTDTLISFMRVFQNIADAGSPALRLFLEYVSGIAERAEDATSSEGGLSKMQDFFLRGEEMAEGILDLGIAISKLFLSIVTAGAESGNTAILDLTTQVQRATNWINSHQRETRKFFEDARQATYLVLSAVVALVRALADLYHPEQVKLLTEAFEEVLLPALVIVTKTVGTFVSLLLRLVNTPIGNSLAQLGISAMLLHKFFAPLTVLFGSMLRYLGLMVGSTRLLRAAFFALQVATGPIGIAIAAISAAILILNDRLGFLDKLLELIRNNIGLMVPLLLVVGRRVGVFGTLASSLRAIPGLIGAIRTAFMALAGGAGIGAAIGALTSYLGLARQAGAAGGASSSTRGGTSTIGGRQGGTTVIPTPIGRRPAPDTPDATPGRGGRIARGVGIAGLIIGGAAATQINPGGLRDASMAGELARTQAGLQNLMSLNISGFFGVLGRNTSELQEFASNANRDLRRLTEQRNVKGLQELADQGRKLANQYPNFAGALNQVADAADKAAGQSSTLNRRLRGSEDIIERLKRRGLKISVEIAARTPKNLLSDLEFFLRRLQQGIPRSVGQLREELANQIDRVNQVFAAGGKRTPDWFKAMGRTYSAAIDNINRLVREGKLGAEEADRMITKLRRSLRLVSSDGKGEVFGRDFAKQIRDGSGDRQKAIDGIIGQLGRMPEEARQIAGRMVVGIARRMEQRGDIPKGTAKRLASDIGVHFRDMRDINVTRAGQMVQRIGGQFRYLPEVTRSGLDTMGDNLNSVLKSMGAEPVRFTLKKLAAGKVDITQPPMGSNLMGGQASGGFIGNEGERGKDDPRYLVHGRPVGRGEAVLNWIQQKAINPVLTMAKSAGFSPFGSIAEVFRGTRGYHAGVAGEVTGFSGGFAGTSPSGNRTVPFPGFPGEFIAANVVKEAVSWVRRYKAFVTDAFATAGHVGGGHLQSGTAMDVVPGPGGSWDLIDRMVSAARAAGLTVLYDGVAGHGRGHHAHIELASGVAAAGAAMAKEARKLRRLVVQGPKGGLRDAVQGSLDKARKEGNKLLTRRARRSGTDLVPHESAYDGPLNRLFPQHSASEPGIQLSLRQVVGLARRAGFGPDSGHMEEISRGESTRRPGVVSWDGGWGLLQMTPRVWGAQALKWLSQFGGIEQMLNPWKNMLMAKKLYDNAKAGGGRGFEPWFGTKYLTAARGGELPGPLGKAINILAHGREWILNERQKSKLARLTGMSIESLRDQLGLRTGAQMAADGTEVSEKKDPPTLSERIGSLGKRVDRSIDIPTLELGSPEWIRSWGLRLNQIMRKIPGIFERLAKTIAREVEKQDGDGKKAEQRTKKLMGELRAASDKSFTKAFAELAGDNGLIAQMEAAIDRAITNAGVRLKRATFRIDKTRQVVRRLDPVQVADKELRDLERQYGMLMGERGLIIRSMRTITGRIRRIERGGVSKSEQKMHARLEGFRNRLQVNLEDLQSSIADNIEARYEAAETAVNARVEAVDERATLRGNAIDRAGRVAGMVGSAAARVMGMSPMALAAQRQGMIGEQIGGLQGALAEARRRRARPELIRQLEDQIADLQVQMSEAVQAGIQSSLEDINNRASRAQAGLDLRGRLADLMERAGNSAGAFSERANILGGQRRNLISQQSELQSLLHQAAASGQGALVEQIGDQLAELNVQLQENTAAIAANTVAARQAQIDRITGRGSFLGGVFGGLGNLLTSLATNTGFLDVARQQQLLQQAGAVLGQTGSGLRQQFFEAFGIDLRNLDPVGLVDKVKGLNFDQITAGMSVDQKAQFEALINAIIDNAGAVQANTEQLNQLNSPNAQSFSSTAWQWFRNAIFNGAGGLLPQYQIPMMDAGGDILSDGLIYGHRGERIVAAEVNRNGGAGDVFAPHIEAHQTVQDIDEETLVNKLMFRFKTMPRG